MDLSLAALTGDGVFNFGEVLATPLLGILRATPHAWLSELLQVRVCVCGLGQGGMPVHDCMYACPLFSTN